MHSRYRSPSTRFTASLVVMLVVSLLVNTQAAIACQMMLGAAEVSDQTSSHQHHHNAVESHHASMEESLWMAGCCDPSERSVVWLETVAADVCCDEVQALGWIGVDPTADVTDTPLLYSPAFAWIDPLYIPDLTANPVQHVIVLDASYTDNHVLQADEPPVYQSTLRYRL